MLGDEELLISHQMKKQAKLQHLQNYFQQYQIKQEVG